jgi:phosphoribosyl 1,2-cyclic phosphodiesterase
MQASVWGCRGSVAAPGPETVRYGGNTSCVELRLADGTVVILDAGTGIRALGLRLAEESVQRIHLFLSHLHLDHLQGLAFFAPLYNPDVELHVWGPRSPVQKLEDRIGVYMSEPLFPVNLSDVPCRPSFHDAPEEPVTVGSATVWSSPVSHQGPTVGYRVEESGRSLVYIPDHEPARGTDVLRVELPWLSGYELAAGADVLLHDAQYSPEEYPMHVGWGHSSIDDVVGFAVRSDVEQLVLFHHDPRHSDATLERLLHHACDVWEARGGGPARPVLAYEGMRIALDARVASDITGGAGSRAKTLA